MFETLCFSCQPSNLAFSSVAWYALAARSVSFHDHFLRRCFTMCHGPPLGWWFPLHTGPLNPPSPPSSQSWPERGEEAGPPYCLWVWIRSFIAYTHHCRTLLTAPRTWVPRNSRSLGPGKKPKIRRGDMVFQTQPPCWTDVPRLKSWEGGGGVTESNRWTQYRSDMTFCACEVC